MALRQEQIIRAKRELGYNVVGVGGEVYTLGGYAAVFDKGIEPYLVDYSTTTTTIVSTATTPTVVALTLVSNPPISGLANQTQAFVQGATVTVDVGPLQETNVVILGITGLVINVTLSLAHGAYGSYPVTLQGAEQAVSDVFARIDAIQAQMRTLAPQTAGIRKADEVEFFPAEKGKRGTRNMFDDLLFQRDLARKDLAALLGVPNLWEIRGKYGGGSGSQSFEAY